MEETLKKILNELTQLNNRVGSLETEVKSGFDEVRSGFDEVRSGFEGVNKKLDIIYAQVAHNTEQEVKLNEVTTKVESLETDVKLIKKVVTNQ